MCGEISNIKGTSMTMHGTNPSHPLLLCPNGHPGHGTNLPQVVIEPTTTANQEGALTN